MMKNKVLLIYIFLIPLIGSAQNPCQELISDVKQVIIARDYDLAVRQLKRLKTDVDCKDERFKNKLDGLIDSVLSLHCNLLLEEEEERIRRREKKGPRSKLQSYLKDPKCKSSACKERINSLLDEISKLEKEEIEIEKNAKDYASNVVIINSDKYRTLGIIIAEKEDKNKLVIASYKTTPRNNVTVSFSDKSLSREPVQTEYHLSDFPDIILFETNKPQGFTFRKGAFKPIQDNSIVLLGDRVTYEGGAYVEGVWGSLAGKKGAEIGVELNTQRNIQSLGGPAITEDGIVGIVTSDNAGQPQVFEIKKVNKAANATLNSTIMFFRPPISKMTKITGATALAVGLGLEVWSQSDFRMYKNIPVDSASLFRGRHRAEFYRRAEERHQMAIVTLVGGSIILLSSFSEGLIKKQYEILGMKGSISPYATLQSGFLASPNSVLGISIELNF